MTGTTIENTVTTDSEAGALRISITDPNAAVTKPITSPWDVLGINNKLTNNAGTYGAGYFTTFPNTYYNDFIKTIIVTPVANKWGSGFRSFKLSPASTTGMAGIPVFAAATLDLVDYLGNLAPKNVATQPKAWI
jgi:hypothetical protein